MSFAPTSDEREEHLKIQTLMTQEMQSFSDNLMSAGLLTFTTVRFLTDDWS